MYSVTRRRGGLVLGCLISLSMTGCTRENPAFILFGEDSDTDVVEDDLLESAGDELDSSTSGPGPTGGLSDASAGTTGAGTDGAATTDEDGTTAGDSAGTDDATTGAPVEPEPARERLINYTLGASCDHAGWCVDNLNNDQTLMVNIAGAECFTASLPPPFELTEIHYVISDALGELAGSFALGVIEFSDAGPGAPIADLTLQGAEWSAVGEHTLTLDEPLVIDAPGFCVRLEGGVDEQSTLGIGLDLNSAVPSVSFIQSAGCGVPALTDWFAVDNALQTGNWCVDVEIREPS